VRKTILVVARGEAFTAVKFQVEVFWVMMTCSVVVGYKRCPEAHAASSSPIRKFKVLKGLESKSSGL
jgi:hypothetical protein